MSFWSDLFGNSKRDSKRKKARKKTSPKRQANNPKVKEWVIFDKYDDKLIMRVKAGSEAKATKMVKSDDHRVMSAARWDREHL